MAQVSITREPDDPIADVRVSLGSPRGMRDFYIVFRGDPEKVVELLDNAAQVARHALPEGLYTDKRGRPQG
jgi:hypothetical protein